MAAKRTGLGRGISSLIPSSREGDEDARPVDVFFPEGSAASTVDHEPEVGAVPGARLVTVSPDDVTPNPRQPRREFDPEALEELTASIREVGVLQPIVVRPDDDRGGRYELVMGERRWRAALALGLAEIPAVLKETADDAMLRDALLENLHRSQLSPLEEASAYQQLLADFGITQDQLSERIGRSRPQISNTLRLLRLPEGVQARVASGVLSAGHARAILAAGDAEAMTALADKIVREDLSVRAAEQAASPSRAKPAPRPAPGRHRGHLDEIAERLGDRLETRVKVSLSSRKGQVVIDFATIQDLNRILAEIGEPGYDR